MREDGGSYPELLKSEGPRSNQVLIFKILMWRPVNTEYIVQRKDKIDPLLNASCFIKCSREMCTF